MMFGKGKKPKEIKIDHDQESDQSFFTSLPESMATENESELADWTDQERSVFSVPGAETEPNELTSWINEEDKLPIDVFQDDEAIYIKSPVPGADVKDIDINIVNDLITIRVQRAVSEVIEREDYFFQECYWGSLSRSIILPTEVNPGKIKAALQNGILTITLPKASGKKFTKISVTAQE